MDDEYGVRLRVNPVAPDIDIVIVHGLAGHASTTFEEVDAGGRTRNWIKDADFLPARLPMARVFTFGYNANLFEDVVSARALVNRADKYRPIVAATTSIVFLGTPHNGSFLASNSALTVAQRLVAWAMARHDFGRLTEELKPFSDTLRDTSNDFKDIANNFEMLSFVEQKPTRLPPPEFDQLIVPQGSAVMNHPKEQYLPLYQTHRDLCKFDSPNNSAYLELIQQVEYLTKLAIAKHWRTAPPELPPRPIDRPSRTQTMNSEQNIHYYYHYDQSRPPQSLPQERIAYANGGARNPLNPRQQIELNPMPTSQAHTEQRASFLPMTESPTRTPERGRRALQSSDGLPMSFQGLNLSGRPERASPPVISLESPVFEEEDMEEVDEEDSEDDDDDGGPFSRLSMFDTVFIVDDTRSMTRRANADSKLPSRWSLLEKSMAAFIGTACAQDDDGVDLHFLKNKVILTEIREGQQILDKLAEIKKTLVNKDPVTAGGTFMKPVLERVIKLRLEAFAQYRTAGNANMPDAKEPTPLNLIVMTDGAADDQEEVEIYIKDVAEELDKLKAGPNYIGIQFVQIGDDARATVFLKKLDDDLADKYKIRDMVDTTTWQIGKDLSHKDLLDAFVNILLGAVTRNIDDRDKPKSTVEHSGADPRTNGLNGDSG